MTALRSFASQICVFLLVSQVLTQTISIGTNVVTSTASASSAQLTGISCAVHSYPNGDVGLDLSDGLKTQIQSIKSSSTNSTSVDYKIQQAIIAANYDIQKKQLASAALAEGAFILGTIAYLFSSRPGVPIHIQIPANDVAQMSSAQAEFANPSVMYIVTAGASAPATVPLADSRATAPAVTVSSTVSSASSCPSKIQRCETPQCGGQFPINVCQLPGNKGCKCGPTVLDPIAEPPFDAVAWTSNLNAWTQMLSTMSTMGPMSTGVPSSTAPLSTTLASSTTPAATPTIGPAVCNTYETSYKHCWTNIHPDVVNETANWMIGHQMPNGPMTSANANLTENLGKDGLNYFMNIGWIPGCNMVDSQDAANPIPNNPSVATADILWETYANCSGNHGMGGYSSTGCLRIGFFPNKIPGMGGSPPTPAKYWANPVYC